MLPERVGTGIKYISIYIYIFASSSEDEGILAEGKEQGQKREDLLERLVANSMVTSTLTGWPDRETTCIGSIRLSGGSCSAVILKSLKTTMAVRILFIYKYIYIYIYIYSPNKALAAEGFLLGFQLN